MTLSFRIGVVGKGGTLRKEGMKYECNVFGENLTQRRIFSPFLFKGNIWRQNVIKVVTFSFVQKCKSVNCRRLREFYSKGNRLFFFSPPPPPSSPKWPLCPIKRRTHSKHYLGCTLVVYIVHNLSSTEKKRPDRQLSDPWVMSAA